MEFSVIGPVGSQSSVDSARQKMTDDQQQPEDISGH